MQALIFCGGVMRGTNAETGRRLSGDEHLLQSVADILMTPVGTRVLLRDYGSDLPALVDAPYDQGQKMRIVSATASALAQWEPRIAVTRVQVHQGADGIVVDIEGNNREDGKPVKLKGIKISGS